MIGPILVLLPLYMPTWFRHFPVLSNVCHRWTTSRNRHSVRVYKLSAWPCYLGEKPNVEFNPYHEFTQALSRFQKPLFLKPSTRNRISSLFQSVLEAHNAITTHHPSTQLVCIKSPQNALMRNWLTVSSACQGLRGFSIGTYITLFERTQSALEGAIDFVNIYTS